jgi:hypothetical protein
MSCPRAPRAGLLDEAKCLVGHVSIRFEEQMVFRFNAFDHDLVSESEEGGFQMEAPLFVAKLAATVSLPNENQFNGSPWLSSRLMRRLSVPRQVRRFRYTP